MNYNNKFRINKMNEVLNHTIYDGYSWKDDIKKYMYNKTNIGWDSKETYQPKITSKMIKANDMVFNPILQKYNDPKLESSLQKKENSAIISEIIKNQDNQLKVEQTFNIINLKDRLKGLENDPNYPSMKDLIHSRKRIDNCPKNYNILSNLPLTCHHFDKPENRPNFNFSEPKKGKKIFKFGTERDFDIISTKYKQFNNEKNEVDKEVQKIKTAKIFYKKNDYNIIKGEFYNKEKEEEFQKKRKEEQRTWGIERFNNMPKCVKGKSDIYNLITLKIVDQKEMDKMLKEEKTKRQRYELRYKVEKFYQNENLKNQDKKENQKNGKASFQRYKEQDKRQYDIIDLKEKPYNEHKDIIKTGGISSWQKIIDGAGKNNTFSTKHIYKDPYDYSEAGSSYDNYKKTRNKMMNKLPKIESDKLFNQFKKSKKEERNKMINLSNYESNLNKYNMDKEKFFHEEPRRINMTENNKKIMENSKSHVTYGEANRINKMFEKNREKNMRNKKLSINLQMDKSN